MRFCLLLIFLFPAITAARVFNYKEGGVAAYIRGTGGTNGLNQDTYANSSGNGVVVDGKSQYNYGGEIGFMFSPTPTLHMRIGAEVLQSQAAVGSGASAAGVPYFSVNSSVFVFNPNVTFEFVFSNEGNLRLFGEAGVGYAIINATNDYKMTAAGTAALGSVTDYKETLTGNALSGSLGVGLEELFTDNVTFLADVGYRYLPVKSLKYGSDVKNIVKPAGYASGDSVVNMDGSSRKLNLGGIYAGIGFRFYLNFF